MQILDPSRSVEGNFRSYTVVTGDGHVLTGVLANETKTSIDLLDSDSKQHTILRESIDRLDASSKSLMPDGFEKQISPESMADLLEFLSARGKYVSVTSGNKK